MDAETIYYETHVQLPPAYVVMCYCCYVPILFGRSVIC